MEERATGGTGEDRLIRDHVDVKRKCIVIDTNQWIQHLMLRSPTAAAVLYSLRQQEGVIGLPYVVEEELKRHAAAEGRRARARVLAGLDDLRRLLGSAPSPTLPGDEVLDAAALRRLDELAPLLVRVPVTFEQAQNALHRVLDNLPPNSAKNQQYKDTLIWEGVLALATDFDVLLVTSDKGFYADRDPSKGLASELLADLEAAGLNVATVETLAAAAGRLRPSEPPVDPEVLVGLIDEVAIDVVTSAASDAEFTVGPLTDSVIHVYATEHPDVLAVTFTIRHALHDLREFPRNHAEAVAEGDCIIRDGQVGEFRLDKMSLDWLEPGGQAGHAGIVYGRGTVHLGERHEPYTVRTEIRLPGS